MVYDSANASKKLIVQEIPSNYPDKNLLEGSQRVYKFQLIIGILLVIAFSITCLAFGGIHPQVTHPLRIIIYSISAYVLTLKRNPLATIISNQLVTALVLWCLLGFLTYTILQTFVFANLGNTLPEPFSVSGTINVYHALESILSTVSFLLTFVVVAVCAASPYVFKLFVSYFISIGVIVSLLALGHWFHDNGKLFGYFEPLTIFTSGRARWPFVNANHLATFLIPCFFICLAKLRELTNSVTGDVRSKHSPRNRFAKAVIYLTSLLSIFLGVLASQSRGTWIAIGTGALIFFLFDSYHGHRKQKSVNKMKFRNKHNRFDKALLKLGRTFRPIAILLFLALSFMFLAGKGSEQIHSRISHTISHSHQDLRWDLYQATFQQLSDNYVYGIGFGAWQDSSKKYYSSRLSDISVSYAHSDPLQLLVEVGIVGLIPVLAAIFFLCRSFTSALKYHGGLNHRLIGIFVGIVATLIASCFEFPFRSPAIILNFCCLVALLCIELSAMDKNASSN